MAITVAKGNKMTTPKQQQQDYLKKLLPKAQPPHKRPKIKAPASKIANTTIPKAKNKGNRIIIKITKSILFPVDICTITALN
jgi:hypothetical protein